MRGGLALGASADVHGLVLLGDGVSAGEIVSCGGHWDTNVGVSFDFGQVEGC